MNKIVLITTISIILFSCNPIQIKHVSQVSKFNKNNLVFSLPKTVLTLHLTLEKQIVKKGPYAEFTEKYVGISNPVTRDIEKYSFKNIEINDNIIADTNQVFVLQYKHQLPWESLIQQSDGVILAINQTMGNTINNKSSFRFTNPTFDKIVFKELSQSSYIKDKIDTIYKQVKVDTNWVRVAVQKKTTDTLKLEDKAKEAAQHIFEIRSRLFDLLSGDMETLPQGEAAISIIEYLKSEEQEYLSLFVGKTYVTTVEYNFVVIPENINQNEFIIAYVDPNKGIVKNASKNSQTIKLSLNTYDSYKPYTLAQLKYQKAQKKNIFPYRMPVQSEASVLVNDEIMYKKNLWIYQFGKTMEVPICFLKKYKFDFSNPTILTISK